MATSIAPLKTAAGQAELADRRLRLSQRHRTVLLLVDGRRSIAEVLHMATQAGVPTAAFHELIALGLVDPYPGAEDSLLPSVQTLVPESNWGTLDAPAPDTSIDRPLEEARELLLRAVRNEAPVSGSLTLLKLKRAASREEIEALLDEVEQRIRKPRKQIIAAQTLRHVRHLLSLPG